MEGKYKKLKPSYISEDAAIAIVNSDFGLKDSIYKEGLKNNLHYDLIEFKEFGVRLVKYDNNFAWHIKVVSGNWGATKFIKFLGLKISFENIDGIFEEENNINCLVFIDSGKYVYLRNNDLSDFENVSVDEYNEYIDNYSSLKKEKSKIYDYETDNK